MHSRQSGVSLVELLVGITIGLLVIGAATGSLLISRTASGSVSDMSQLQQQGSYALRVIGLQVRQAGSLEVSADPTTRLYSFDGTSGGFAGGLTAVTGADGPTDSVSMSNQAPSATGPERRDCLGDAATGPRIENTFYVDDTQLRCRTPLQNQALIQNVAGFQVWYRSDPGTGIIQRVTADQLTAAGLWGTVRSVEVCLDLLGNESGNPQSGSYIDCRNASVPRNGHLHLVFRNVFELRQRSMP